MHYCKMILLLFLALLLSSCSTKSDMQSYVRQDVDLGYITRIAVIPFENNTNDKYSSERVRDMAITQTLALGLFDVVDKGIIDNALREEAIDLVNNSLNNTDLLRLGQILGTEAFLLGTVDQAGTVQRGPISYPQLSLTLRLLDIKSGKIIWQASGNESGYSPAKRLFGISTDDEFRVAFKLMRKLLNSIPKAAEVTPKLKSDSEESIEDIKVQEPSEDGDLEFLLEQG